MYSPIITAVKAGARGVAIAAIGVLAVLIAPTLEAIGIDESAIIVALTAGLAAVWRAVQNWLKHRND